jgi:hypothetical protein
MRPIDTLRNAIGANPFRPAGVKVSADLWKELEAAGLIQNRPLHANNPNGFTFNAYDNDIAIEVDSSLPAYTFEFPQSPK